MMKRSGEEEGGMFKRKENKKDLVLSAYGGILSNLRKREKEL